MEKNWLNVCIVLLIMNLLSYNMGCFSHSYSRICAFFLLITVIFLNIPFGIRKHDFNPMKSIFFLLVLIAFIILFLFDYRGFWLVAVPIFLFGFDGILRCLGKQQSEFSILMTSSLFYAIFILLVDYIPQFWCVIQKMSLSFSHAIGCFIERPLSLGPSVSGFWILTVFLFYLITLFTLSERKKKEAVFSTLALILMNVVYLLILCTFLESDIWAVNSQILFFTFGLFPVVLYTKRSKIQSFSVTNGLKNRNLIPVALVLLILAISVLTFSPVFQDKSSKEIMFYEKGFLINWDVPKFGNYTISDVGLYGLIPEYLGTKGYETNIVGTITPYALKKADVLVIIDLNENFSSTEHKAIWDFVKGGGSLLVLGDHTDMGGIMSPLNTLLDPAGIGFRFDTGQPIKRSWISCMELKPSPITEGIKHPNEVQVWGGASLDVTPPAFPVIIGRYALSDGGDYSNAGYGAFLGNREYDVGEQLGDIILVAGAYYGKGKVLVFGDTSTFQNSIGSYTYPFIDKIFGWLTSETLLWLAHIKIAISILLLLSALILLFLKTGLNGVLVFMCSIMICISLLLSGAITSDLVKGEEAKGSIVYIDVSHGERFNLGVITPESVQGLPINLVRNGFTPIILRDFSPEKISDGKVLVFIAPTKTFTKDEVNFLRDFVYTGGLVIVSVGYLDKGASMPLLDEFGFNIAPIPLGPVPLRELELPREYFNETKFIDSWPILIKNEGTHVFYAAQFDNQSYPIVTFRRYGEGGFLLIGDSEFLLDKNLEGESTYWEGNIIFIRNVFEALKNEGVPK